MVCQSGSCVGLLHGELPGHSWQSFHPNGILFIVLLEMLVKVELGLLDPSSEVGDQGS